MRIETKLHEEIQEELKGLKQIELGTDEYRATVDGLTKLMDRAIEINKLDSDREDKLDQQAVEMEFKTQQLEEDIKDRKTRNRIAIAGLVVPTVVTIWGTLKTLKFEESGTVTTNAGRNFINRIFKK